jgi:hypothetical protein
MLAEIEQFVNWVRRITSIQKFLGHKRLNTTLTYARAHDQTVADDYYQAMRSVEKRMELLGQQEEKEEPVTEDERRQTLALTEKLIKPELCANARLAIAAQIRLVVLAEVKELQVSFENNPGRKPQDHPPPPPFS